MNAETRQALRAAIDARRRELAQVSDVPRHNLTGYVRYRCRCDICRAAHTACARRYVLRRAAKEAKLAPA